jgi:hypothetical protein
MIGMDALLSSPTIVGTAIAAAGLTAARIDYNRRTDVLLLSVALQGQIRHIRIPVGVTFTRAEICRFLTDPAADLTAAAMSGAEDPHGFAQPAAATSGDPPGSP